MKSGGALEERDEKSSLRLLEAIVEVGSNPDKFHEVCYDWAEKSDMVEGFDSLLNIVFLQSLSKISPFDANRLSDHYDIRTDNNPMSFLMNAELKVLSIGHRAAEILDISLGDDAAKVFNVRFDSILDIAKSSADKKIMGDVYAADGSRHIASVARVKNKENSKSLYLFTLWKVELPVESEAYLREQLLLTNAEVEILELVLERRSIQSISEVRKGSVNTTRKHINNIKKKFKSNSLSDVISSTHEIIALHYKAGTPISGERDLYEPLLGRSQISNLTTGANRVEYARYGNPRDIPLVILHSIEYGIRPPTRFAMEAIKAGYCVYVPIRPGFGRTTLGEAPNAAADILEDFFSVLNLKNVTLVSLSTAAPTAIDLVKQSRRIRRMVFVNYGFDTQEKIQHIKPVWLQGLLKFALGSEGSFKFAFHSTKRMMRIIGFKSFYRRIYQNCEEDLKFLEENPESFRSSANLFLSAKPKAARWDFKRAFIESPVLESKRTDEVELISIFGEHTHGISIEPIKKATEKLGIRFHVFPNCGRNCIYQKPSEFFKILGA